VVVADDGGAGARRSIGGEPQDVSRPSVLDVSRKDVWFGLSFPRRCSKRKNAGHLRLTFQEAYIKNVKKFNIQQKLIFHHENSSQLFLSDKI
jgi:hypothetical protein